MPYQSLQLKLNFVFYLWQDLRYNIIHHKRAEKTNMIGQKVQVKNTRYFQVINCHYKYALYISSGAENFENEKAFLEVPKPESLGQAWQIIEVDPTGWKKGLYEFVHTRSTLVLSRLKGQFFLKQLYAKTEKNQVRLRFGEWGSNQLFYLQQVNPNDFPNIYRFSSHENRHCYLFYHNYLRVQQIDPNDTKCHWELRPCYENPIINRSCYLENAYSTLAMDVPAGSKKPGCSIIQWPLNNRFNQRFNIFKAGSYHKIANLNSKLFLTCTKKAELGEIIKQENSVDELYQMWILDYQGKNLYLVRSAVNPQVMVGIKDHNLKAQSPLVLTGNQDFGLWKIIGFIPH